MLHASNWAEGDTNPEGVNKGDVLRRTASIIQTLKPEDTTAGRGEECRTPLVCEAEPGEECSR